MSPKKIRNDKPEEVSSDIIYQELYQEMRRYRDYELSASMWYTTILLAVLGAILSAKYGGNLGLEKFMDECIVKFITAFIILIIGSSGMWSVYFSHRRYNHLRSFVNDLKIEPDWRIYEPEPIFPEPRHLILITQLSLVILSIAIVFRLF